LQSNTSCIPDFVLVLIEQLYLSAVCCRLLNFCLSSERCHLLSQSGATCQWQKSPGSTTDAADLDSIL